MGLAEPRKRLKISHDPNNLQWSEATSSYGQRLMQRSGWKAGEALGKHPGLRASDSEAAKVKISHKDDMLGLGASLKSRNVEHQRTGLDAFQGLLGRLNAKDDRELQIVEQKIEDKKLAMFAQGRWGGMVFVPGGLLVQKDPAEVKKELSQKIPEESTEVSVASKSESDGESREARAKRKAEKKQRKEDRRARKEAKRLRKAQNADLETSGTSTPILTGTSTDVSTPVASSDEIRSAVSSRDQSRNGRHILRGKNIHAKRAAFSDMKGLDQIFMRQAQTQAG